MKNHLTSYFTWSSVVLPRGQPALVFWIAILILLFLVKKLIMLPFRLDYLKGISWIFTLRKGFRLKIHMVRILYFLECWWDRSNLDLTFHFLYSIWIFRTFIIIFVPNKLSIVSLQLIPFFNFVVAFYMFSPMLSPEVYLQKFMFFFFFLKKLLNLPGRRFTFLEGIIKHDLKRNKQHFKN